MQESVKPKLGFGILKAKINKMNTLQQIIREMEDDLLHITKAISVHQTDRNINSFNQSIGMEVMCNKYILKLKLLLKEETAKDLPDSEVEKLRKEITELKRQNIKYR